jgi:hypothetical protein
MRCQVAAKNNAVSVVMRAASSNPRLIKKVCGVCELLLWRIGEVGALRVCSEVEGDDRRDHDIITASNSGRGPASDSSRREIAGFSSKQRASSQSQLCRGTPC